MSQEPIRSTDRTRKNVEDFVLLVTSAAIAVVAILEFGPPGLAGGSILLSVAAFVVVRREFEANKPGDVGARDPVATDGGREN